MLFVTQNEHRLSANVYEDLALTGLRRFPARRVR